MGFWNTALSVLGCGIGIPVGLIIGYFLFVYFLDHHVKDPIIRNIEDLDSKALQRLLLEIPLWVKSPDYERVDWLNKFFGEMWPYLDKAICKIIRDTAKFYVDQYSQRYKIKSVEFKALTLGTLPPKLQGMILFRCYATGIKFYETQEDAIIIEPAFKWFGNPDINIEVSLFGVSFSVQLVDLQVSILPRISMKPLVPAFPCFSRVSVSLMEEPDIDFGLKLCGADLMAIPLVYRSVQDILKDQVAQLYLWPNTLEVTILDDPRVAQKPVGILNVNVIRATHLKKMDIIGKSDPYVKLKLTGDKLSSRKTSVKMKTLDPVWNESFNFSVKDPQAQALELHAYDWDKIGTHDKLGMQIIPLKYIVAGEPKLFTLDLMKTLDPNNESTKQRGKITVELTYNPFKKTDSIPSFKDPQSLIERSFDTSTDQQGVLVVSVHGAEDLEGRHHTNPFVKIIFMGEERRTKALKNNRDPKWDQNFEFMCQNISSNEKLMIQVFSKRIGFSFHSKELLGFVEINLSDVVYNRRINDTYNLIDSKNGKIHVELEWKT